MNFLRSNAVGMSIPLEGRSCILPRWVCNSQNEMKCCQGKEFATLRLDGRSVQRRWIKLARNILDLDAVCTWLVWVHQSHIDSVPKIQSLIDNENVWLSILRVNLHSRNCGDENVLCGFILTTVRTNSVVGILVKFSYVMSWHKWGQQFTLCSLYTHYEYTLFS
jgi:hypothetical protein